MLRKLVYLGIVMSIYLIPIIAKKISNPVPVLSENGLQNLNLYTETAYAIINKRTKTLPCVPTTPLSTLGPDLLNPQHWWKITPSRNFNAKKPTYELINYGNTTGCLFGKQIVFHPTSKHIDGDETDTFFMSTDRCRKIKTCSESGSIYTGVVLLTQEKQEAHFCGNLDFTCTSPHASRHKIGMNDLKSGWASPYQFQFLNFALLLEKKYPVIGKVQDFDMPNVTENFSSSFNKLPKVEDGWRIGFADEIENCASFPHEKDVHVKFADIESSRLEFSYHSNHIMKKLSKYSIGSRSSIAIPLLRFTPIVAVASKVEWGSDMTEVNRRSGEGLNEVRKNVVYEYTTRVTVEPWRVAKVHAILNVVKDYKIGWTGNLVVTPLDLGNGGRMDCLGQENIRNILRLKGYNLNEGIWNGTSQGYQFPINGEIIVSFGVESFVQVTDTECPPEKQVHRSEF